MSRNFNLSAIQNGVLESNLVSAILTGTMDVNSEIESIWLSMDPYQVKGSESSKRL